MKTVKLLLASFLVMFFLVSCEPGERIRFLYQTDPQIRTLVKNNRPSYPEMSFIVLADPHYYTPELGTSGSAFEEYLRHDRKMLKESSEILQAAVTDISRKTADFVIVCGDLTKDGEADSHWQAAALLSEIENQGKSVYVVPGNHDISNGESMRFAGDAAERTPTVSPEEYQSIYNYFGYSEAVAVDSNSLSYIVEPIPGLWLFGLDSCRYRENPEVGHPVTDGKFYTETLTWIEEKLIEAIRKEKAVIGFLHHGVLEHYSSNEKHFDDYLLEDFRPISEMFAAYGMRFVFTGHYHSQDITQKTWTSSIPNHFLFDIETGSLVTYPVPWRHITVRDQAMTITSHSVESIDSRPGDFLEFAEAFIQDGMVYIINEALAGYSVPEADQVLLSPQIAEAYVTHLQGDEQAPDQYLDFTGVSPAGVAVGTFQGDLIRGWYNDLPPADNSLTIDMATGQVD